MDRSELERETATALVAAMSDDHPDNDEAGRREAYQRCLHSFAGYTTEALRLFKTIADGPLGEELLHLLAYKHRGEHYLADWIMIEPYSGLAPNIDVHYVIRSLPHYENLAPQHQRARRTAQSRAILRVMDHFVFKKHGYSVEQYEEDERYAIIADEKLRTLLTTYPDPAAVADVVITRDITDADQIIALLETMNTTEKALGNGTL